MYIKFAQVKFEYTNKAAGWIVHICMVFHDFWCYLIATLEASLLHTCLFEFLIFTDERAVIITTIDLQRISKLI